MLRYAAASHGWRAIPLRLADWAWQRRGRLLIQRAARSVPAYSRLLRIFGHSTASAFADPPSLQTSRRSYVDVFPLELRCRQGGQRQAVSFEPLSAAEPAGSPSSAAAVAPCHLATPSPCQPFSGAVGGRQSGSSSLALAPCQSSATWPRDRSEMRILREQLVGLLSGWFDATSRRSLLVLALPEAGWSGRHRISQALQEAIRLGHLRASLVDLSQGDLDPFAILRLASGFEQCLLLADPSHAVQADWLGRCTNRTGTVVFGPRPTRLPAGPGHQAAVCSVLGADEAGPLIALETPFSRLVLDACRSDRLLAEQLMPDMPRPAGLYQPLPRGPWLEQVNGDLLVSSWGACPLVRYKLGWRGTVVPFGLACDLLLRHKVLPPNQIRRLTRMESTCWKLPLIALPLD